jgi:hypothetical protein
MNEKYIAILLIGTFMLSAMRFIIPFASYDINYQYFSQVACINKNKPEMHCDGTCQLKRMIKKINHTDKNKANNRKDNVNHSVKRDFFCSQIFHLLTQPHHSDSQYLSAANEIARSLFWNEPTTPSPRLS